MIVIYARANSKPEVDRQFQMIQKSLDPGADVVGRYSDVGSGMDSHRPGLQQALDHVLMGKVEALMVHSIDRLSRSVQELGMLASMFRIEVTKEPENLD